MPKQQRAPLIFIAAALALGVSFYLLFPMAENSVGF
jgi:hypothetical protein